MWFATLSVLIGSQCLFLILFVDSVVSYSDKFHNESGTFPEDSTSDETHTVSISGGEPTLLGEFPYMAALGWRDGLGDLGFHCGGMLIASRFVLTAAHCVFFNGKIPDVVHIGGHIISEGLKYNQEFSIVNATIYPKYDKRQAYYDIALLELDSDAEISPISLWTKPNLCVDNVTAIGYGLTAFAGQRSQELLKVNLTVFSSMFCEPFFTRQRKFKSGLSEAHICAGDMNGQKDTCQGDSGGPLIAVHEGTSYAVGITSVGQGCSGFPPGIYTKIASYISWINETVNELGYSMGTEYV